MFQKILSLFIESKLILVFIIFNQTSFCIFKDRDVLANKSAVGGVSFVGCELSDLFHSHLINLYFSRTNLLGLSELASNTLCLRFNKNIGSLGFFYNNYGFELYKENLFILNLSGKIKRKVYVNANVKFLDIYVKSYEKKFFSSADLGVLANINYLLDSGFLVKNVIALCSNEDIEKQLISINRLNFFKIAKSYIDIVKSNRDFIFIRVAEEIKIPTKVYDLFLRFGVETATLSKLPKYSFGLGFCFKNVKYDIVIDYSFVYTSLFQQQLISLGMNFIKLKTINECSMLLDLNTASEEELKEIPGIGPKIARRIVEYREKYGCFNSIYELIYIPGITAKKIEEIKKYLYVKEKTDTEEK